jgi:hypothetical protein
MKAEQRKLPGESNIHWFPERSSVEPDTSPFTGGLAPNRFQKPLGMRRKPFKSDLS